MCYCVVLVCYLCNIDLWQGCVDACNLVLVFSKVFLVAEFGCFAIRGILEKIAVIELRFNNIILFS